MLRHVLGSSARKILREKRESGRRMQGSSKFTPLLRSWQRDKRSAMVLAVLGMCSNL